MKELTITYQDYIPDEIISDFRRRIQVSQLPVTVTKKTKRVGSGRWNNFETVEIFDIVINLQSPELILGIVGGVISSVAAAGIYDIFKTGIKHLWMRISKPSIQKIGGEKRISFRITDNMRGIEICFEGEVNEEQADKILDSLTGFISSDLVTNAFDNPDYVSDKNGMIEMHANYNKDKGIWELENFGEQKRKMDALRKQIEKNFRS